MKEEVETTGEVSMDTADTAPAERERLPANKRVQARRQAALLRLSAELAATLNETEVCRRAVEGLRDTLGYDFVALFLVDETTDDRVLAASVGFVGPPTRVPPGQGVSERVLLDGQLQYMPDVTQDPRYIPGLGGSEVDVPVPIGGEVLGVLIVESRQPHAFGQGDFEVLTAAAQQTGLAIEKARLLAAERQRADELDALRTTLADITTELELSTLLQAIVERAAGLLDATGGELGLYDEASQELRIVVSYNLGEDYVGTRHALGEGAMGRVAETREPLIIEDYHTWGGSLPQYSHVHATLVAPLEVGGRLVGVFTTVTTDPTRQFGPADLRLLNMFAQQAAIAVENARLYDRAQREIAERKRFEEEISRQKEYFEALFVNNPVAVVTADLDGKIVSWNPMAEKLFQCTQEEAIGKDLDDIVANDDSLRAEAAGYTDQVINLERVQVSTRRTRKDGSLVDVELLALPVIVAGEKVGFIAIYHDISERKRAEIELRKYQEHLEELVEERTTDLRESEERYRGLYDGVPVGLYRTTPAGEIVDANPALVEMLGYPSEEHLLAINSANLYADPEDRVQWGEIMKQEGPVCCFEVRFRCYDGTIIWVTDTAKAVRDEQGQVVHYEGSIEDITKRKQAEAELRKYREHLEELVEERTVELRESEERFRTLFDGVPVGLYRSTPAGQIVDANPTFVEIAGYPARENLLEIDAATFYVDPEDQMRWQTLMEREGLVRDSEYQFRQYGGTVIWISDTARAVKDKQGQVLYYEGSVEDITERRRAEHELRQAKEAAETANRAKSTFLANMSHELRTPLNAILGFTQLMDGDPNLTAEQQENLRVINRSGEHLLTLINDVLEMSKIEAGRVTLQERSFDLYALLDSLEEMFRLRTEDKGLELIFDRSPDVRQYMRADESKLRQVLMNLLSNAVKFTQEGGVTLRVGCPPSIPLAGGREEDKEEGCLVFEIEDTGPGIAPEELEAVFDPFVQTASGQQSHEGTGLGLPISRQFTRLMGSDITVSSKLGEGSIFRFEVPIGLADAAEVQVVQPSQRVLGLEPGQEVYRLLIVDDREVTRELMVKLLRPLGFEVREAVNGQEGLEVWKQWQPHLIWMDMRMPVLDGYEATRRIKAAPEGQATAVVALTASAFEEDRETILSAGCDDVVRKPFRKDEIFDILTKHLGVRFVYEGERAQPTTAQSAQAAALLTDLLTPAALAVLPANWLADLQQATTRADLNLILTLVDQIRQQDAALADALSDLAYDFEYKKILTLIEQAGG